VLLDLSHRGEEFARSRFPRVFETCLSYGVNIGTGPAPIAPAAHYAMGGVWTDLDGCTTIPRLFAAGEVACTGVHGANRLASNSLLEGVVFGIRAGRAMRGVAPAIVPATELPPAVPAARPALDAQRIAWEKCGIIRSAEGLTEACAQLEPDSVAYLIARCALARHESRGAHFRSDFPEKSSAYEKHSVIRKDADVTFR
jgi:L-aspartate oxidase